ncbi:hypothetical protein OAG94_01935, partial [bacterium]|nr:hypothetical protein [bacterium]
SHMFCQPHCNLRRLVAASIFASMPLFSLMQRDNAAPPHHFLRVRKDGFLYEKSETLNTAGNPDFQGLTHCRQF